MKKLGLLVVPFLLVGLVACGKGEAKENGSKEPETTIYDEIGKRNSKGEIEGRFVNIDGKTNNNIMYDISILYPRNKQFTEPSDDEYYAGKPRDVEASFEFKSLVENETFQRTIGQSGLFHYLYVSKDDKETNDSDQVVQAICNYNNKIEKIGKKYYHAGQNYFNAKNEIDTVSLLAASFSACSTVDPTAEPKDSVTFNPYSPDWVFVKYVLGYYETALAFNQLTHELNTGNEEQIISSKLAETLWKTMRNLSEINHPLSEETELSYYDIEETHMNEMVRVADKLFSKDILKAELKAFSSKNSELMAIPQDIYPVKAN